MEKTREISKAEVVDINSPIVQKLAEHRYAMWDTRLTLFDDNAGRIPLQIYRHPHHIDFIHDIYGVDNFDAAMEASGHRREQGIMSDFELWAELGRQACLAFDEENNPRFVGDIYLRGLEDMSEEGIIAGAAMAADSVYNRVDNRYTEDEALAMLQAKCGFDNTTMQDLLRLAAMPFGRETTQYTADRVFLVAANNPEGITRQAVAGESGEIDVRFFGGKAILERSLAQVFSGIINGMAYYQKGAEENFAALRQNFPQDYETVASSPSFIKSTRGIIRHKLLYDSARGETAFPSTVFDVVPREDVIAVAEKVLGDLQHYRNNAEERPGVIGDPELLKKLGIQTGGLPHYYTQKAIKAVEERLENLQNTENTQVQTA